MARRSISTPELQAQRRVGERIRQRRRGLDLSQEALAHLCGLHRTFVGTIERGEANPTLGTLVLLANGLDVDVAELVQGVNVVDGTISV